MPPRVPEPILDQDHADFMVSGVSIAVCSSGTDLRPSLARAWGCSVSADRRRVSVYVSPGQAGALLSDLRGGRPIAVVFSLPSSHRTIQLKAPGATVERCSARDQAVVTRYRQAFGKDLERVGHGGSWAAAYLRAAGEELVRVTFRPDAAFAQTPGPRAGEPLHS